MLNMTHNKFNSLSEKLDLDNIKLLYEGKISVECVEDLLFILKRTLEQICPSRQYSRSLRVAVEILQNIAKHADNANEDESHFALFKSGKDWCFYTRNTLNNKDKEVIESTYDKIKHYDVEQLKDAYREVLSATSINEKGGAGLGLIDIAYRTKQVPDYRMNAISGTDKYEFQLKVNMNWNDGQKAA
jgi:Family of unknown function (DUF6272)